MIFSAYTYYHVNLNEENYEDYEPAWALEHQSFLPPIQQRLAQHRERVPVDAIFLQHEESLPEEESIINL